MADNVVFNRSATSKYTGTDQSGQCGRCGNGRTTCHQNKSEAPKKQACSSLCHAGERSARSKATGTCQAQSVTAITIQQFKGFVSACPTRISAGQTRKGPNPSRVNFL